MLLSIFSILSTQAHASLIVNGQQEYGFPSVVSLGAEFGDNAFSACTGNVITPKLVLTAAHCSGDLPMEAVLSFGKACFGNSVSDYEHSLAFENLWVHPDYRELGTEGVFDWGEYDVSILELAEESPVEPSPILLYPIEETDVGARLTSVGFGITSANSNVSGQKRSAELVLSGIDSMFTIVYNSDNVDDANICSGDSGGPQFGYDFNSGIAVQWAVHSWGDQNCTSQSGSTRIDVVREWILDHVEDVHGTRDICEANGWYDDGVCVDLLGYCEMEDPDCIIPEPEDEKKGGCQSVSYEIQKEPFDSLGLLSILLLLVHIRRKN